MSENLNVPSLIAAHETFRQMVAESRFPDLNWGIYAPNAIADGRWFGCLKHGSYVYEAQTMCAKSLVILMSERLHAMANDPSLRPALTTEREKLAGLVEAAQDMADVMPKGAGLLQYAWRWEVEHLRAAIAAAKGGV